MYVCVKDGRALRVALNSAYAEQKLEDGSSYKLWATDVWTCPECGFMMAVTASEPSIDHFDPDYSEVVLRASQTRGGLLRGGFVQ